MSHFTTNERYSSGFLVYATLGLLTPGPSGPEYNVLSAPGRSAFQYRF